MCNWFSGILKKDGTVLYLKESTKHINIEEHYKLNKADAGKTYIPFEITPEKSKLLKVQTRQELTEKLHDIFTLSWDYQTTPQWAERNVQNCWKALEQNLEIALIFGTEQVSQVKDYYVFAIWGSAQIKSVYGSAQITYVYDSAQIKSVYGSAQIKYVSDSAQIESVYGSAQIKSVSDSAQILELKDTATAIKDGVIITAKDAKVKKTGKVCLKPNKA